MKDQTIQQRYDSFITTLNKEFQWPLQWCDGAKGESYRKLGSLGRQEWPGVNNEKWFNSEPCSLENSFKHLYKVAKEVYDHLALLAYETADAVAKSEGGSVKKTAKGFSSRTRLGNYQGAMKQGAGFKDETSVKKLQTQLNYLFEGLILGERTTSDGKLKTTNASIDKDKISNAFVALIGNKSVSTNQNNVWKEFEKHINWMNNDFMKGAEAAYDNRWNRLVEFADSHYQSTGATKNYLGKGQKSAMMNVKYTINASSPLKNKLNVAEKKRYSALVGNVIKMGISTKY